MDSSSGIALIKIIQELEAFDNESTIYAAKPWTENSRASVLSGPESGELPSEAKKLGLTYFLEIIIAKNFLLDLAASLDASPTLQEKCLRLIQYATNDA